MFEYQDRIRDVLKDITRLHKEGKTIILITHDLEKPLAHADRLILMDHGKIKIEGHPAELLNVVEEYGIIGAAIVIALYLALFYRGLLTATKSERAYGGLLSAVASAK